MPTRKADHLTAARPAAHSRTAPRVPIPDTAAGSLQFVTPHQGAYNPAQILQLQQAAGNRAVQRLLHNARPAPAQNSTPSGTSPILQRKKGDAEDYIERHSLTVKATYDAISEYVNDSDNPRKHRIGLRKAWNLGTVGRWYIADPGGVRRPHDMEDFAQWDSEEEDETNVQEMITQHTLGKVTLVRSDKSEVGNVPILPMRMVIRVGRQVVKRNEYGLLPVVAKVGSIYVEFKNPGTKDIYATPLLQVGTGSTYKRAGTSRQYNFKNLTARLESEVQSLLKSSKRKREEDDDEEGSSDSEGPQLKKRKLETVFNIFRGKSPDELSEAEAETVAALSCDLMKGSSAFSYMEEAKERLGNEGVKSFAPFFTGTTPFYLPAKKGGRRLVTVRTKEDREKGKGHFLHLKDRKKKQKKKDK